MDAKELREKAEAIEAAANRADDPAAYRREMAKAAKLRAEADKLDPPAKKPAAPKKRPPNVYQDFKSAAAAAREAVARKREA